MFGLSDSERRKHRASDLLHAIESRVAEDLREMDRLGQGDGVDDWVRTTKAKATLVTMTSAVDAIVRGPEGDPMAQTIRTDPALWARAGELLRQLDELSHRLAA